MWQNKRVLVTGGAGFLGSRLVHALVPSGAHIVVLDDLFTGKRDMVPETAQVEFVHGSVTDGTLLDDVLSGTNYVFHFAARNLALSTTQPESDFRTNVEGTVQLLLRARQRSTLERIVYASTSSVYGNSKVLPCTEESYDISLPYAASKMSGELLALAYAKAFHLPVTCLRFSNVYGPGQVSTNPYCGVVSKFMENITHGLPLTIYGDGTQTRDFTYVDDALSAVFQVALDPSTVGEVFNVGTGCETTILQLAQDIVSVADLPAGYPVIYAKPRPIDTVRRRCIDASKLRLATGWQPAHALAGGLIRTWQWFQTSNRNLA